jgi:hypothetical protein
MPKSGAFVCFGLAVLDIKKSPAVSPQGFFVMHQKIVQFA